MAGVFLSLSEYADNQSLTCPNRRCNKCLGHFTVGAADAVWARTSCENGVRSFDVEQVQAQLL